MTIHKMLKTTTNYFVLETNIFPLLSAGKLSDRLQLMHFRKMLSVYSFLIVILGSQFSLGFKFHQQPILSKLWQTVLEPFDWLKGYAVFLRTRGIMIQIARDCGVTFQMIVFFSSNDFLIMSNIVFIILHIISRFAILCTIEQEVLKIRTTFHLHGSQ